MEAAAQLTHSALTKALLEELLPGGRSKRAVLLGCDDNALASVAKRLGIPEVSDSLFRSTLSAIAPMSTEHGLRLVLDVLTEPPDDLIVLCACVLAASRMRPDEGHSTHAYYSRLCDILGFAPRERWPAVAGFEEIPERFDALADWVALQGRGELALPHEPTPALVGVPISQTLLRQVDRDRLGGLFDRHRVALDVGRDPLRLLRSSPVRHQLTAPAQRLLARDDLGGPLRAALDAAYESWDGTVTDERGRRVTAGTLRLGLSPGRATLNLSLPHLVGDVEITGPDGTAMALPAWPAELTLPIEWLMYAREGEIIASAADGRNVRVLRGPTMLFDATDTGFWLTSAVPEDGTVIVLTSDAELLSRDWGPRQARVPLPPGWIVVCDVIADELPTELRAGPHELDEDDDAGGAVVLTGGLVLERGVWLIGHPPALHSYLEEPVGVQILGREGDWIELGVLEPRGIYELSLISRRSGTHTVAANGHQFSFELAARGLRSGVGELAHHPADPYLMRSGAVSHADAELYGDPRPMICGAGVDGKGDPSWRAPVTSRANEITHVIYRDGLVVVAGPTQQPQWARHAQLPDNGSWLIPDGERAVWLCVQSRSYPRVVALRAEDVVFTDDVLDLADWFADAPVIDRTDVGGAEARWRLIVESSREEAEGEGAGG